MPSFSRKPSKNPLVHRDLRFDQDDHQRGADVKVIQRAINSRAKTRGIRPFLKVDGDCGRQTIAKGRQVAASLGLVLTGPGLSKTAQRLIRRPVLRSADQKKRASKYVAPVPVQQPSVVGNVAKGGKVRERICAAAIHAAFLYYQGISHRFYSQPGAWTVDHAITGESSGQRSDCSQFRTGVNFSAGAPDPNGNSFKGGYTGTLGAAGTYIKREQLLPGDNILYGPAPHHHVEVWVGDGVHSYAWLAERNSPLRDRTVGHGSPPVDYGDIDMIADPRFSRIPGV